MSRIVEATFRDEAEYRQRIRGPFVVLFLTDIWERFGFYVMIGVLALFASAPVDRGGLGWSAADAAALFSVWMALTFMLSLPGGWVADRLVGARRALMLGGLLSLCGYLIMTFSGEPGTLAGMFLVSVGAGLYKPSHQTMFSLVITERKRRESGISILYIAVQLSALFAPLIAGFLGERYDWRLAFLSAAIAMLIGLLTLLIAARQFGPVGRTVPRPLSRVDSMQLARRGSPVAVLLVGLLLVLAFTGALNPVTLLAVVGLLTMLVPVAAYLSLRSKRELGQAERANLTTFLWIFLGWTGFWMLVGQGGSVLNLFGRDHTDREFFGFVVPASWLQSVTPLFILVLAPMFAVLLPRIGRGAVSASAFKLFLGLSIAGGSFLVMSVASALASGGDKVSPIWLLIVYLSHACGELIVAAVGVAAVVDVLPPAFTSQMLGLLWLFAALGGGLGSQVVRLATVLPPPVYYLSSGLLVGAFGFLILHKRHAIARALAGYAVPAR
ncbi:POT family proton-dependent oligopeptide transporter [Tamaricihabitans halophyticus]|uniref:POT family proton-dependent oligopeptide transporter n=1 Tax=Tamaricihabitans halophyticus TaxID=1262583 RepID=A0A4R2R259_9PSEU|nr:oligopeptide:H+ symporter [Tamaricihabitans halophyticus]TCP56802.1 POT family proton-dependent oligopeptide transporter [Tamaricihabitans halophyticus]